MIAAPLLTVLILADVDPPKPLHTDTTALGACQRGSFTGDTRFKEDAVVSRATVLFVLGEPWQPAILDMEERTSVEALAADWLRAYGIFLSSVGPAMDDAHGQLATRFNELLQRVEKKRDTADRVEVLKDFFVHTRTSSQDGAWRALMKIGDTYADAGMRLNAASYYHCARNVLRDRPWSGTEADAAELDRHEQGLQRQPPRAPATDLCFVTARQCKDEIADALAPPRLAQRGMSAWYAGTAVPLALSLVAVGVGGAMQHRYNTLQDRAAALEPTKDANPGARDEFYRIQGELAALEGRPARFLIPGGVIGGASLVALVAALAVDCTRRIKCRGGKGHKRPSASVAPWFSRNAVGVRVRF